MDAFTLQVLMRNLDDDAILGVGIFTSFVVTGPYPIAHQYKMQQCRSKYLQESTNQYWVSVTRCTHILTCMRGPLCSPVHPQIFTWLACHDLSPADFLNIILIIIVSAWPYHLNQRCFAVLSDEETISKTCHWNMETVKCLIQSVATFPPVWSRFKFTAVEFVFIRIRFVSCRRKGSAMSMRSA